MSNETIVQLHQVTKKIGGKTIIDNVSLTIPRGTVFGLLGPNGAGKTTIIRMMVGLASLTSGEITINGATISREFEQAIRHVGAIVENPEMYKFLTGYQNLLHNANMLPGVSKERIEEVIALVGLDDSIHQKVKTYSLGMRQRLGIAQALLHRPLVLILDEPTNGLDPAGIRELRDHLRRLAEDEGTSVIVSSHLLSEMELMCDQLAIIQHGKLIEVKSLKDMIQSESDLLHVQFQVNQLQVAHRVITDQFPDLFSQINEHYLLVDLVREQIPLIVSSLVHAGIDIFEVKISSQTLEDKFLQITRGV